MNVHNIRLMVVNVCIVCRIVILSSGFLLFISGVLFVALTQLACAMVADVLSPCSVFGSVLTIVYHCLQHRVLFSNRQHYHIDDCLEDNSEDY